MKLQEVSIMTIMYVNAVIFSVLVLVSKDNNTITL